MRKLLKQSLAVSSVGLICIGLVAKTATWQRELPLRGMPGCSQVSELSNRDPELEEPDQEPWIWTDRNGITRSKQELDTILAQHALWLQTDGDEGKQANLSGADLSLAHLDSANFSRAILTKSILSGATLRETDFSDAQMEGVDLGPWVSRWSEDPSPGADLVSANFFRANLAHANFANTNLRYTTFEDAQLDSAVFFSADLRCSTFDPTTLPDIRQFAYADNLEYINFGDYPSVLVELRNTFRQRGYRAQARAMTYAIRHVENESLARGCWYRSFDIRGCGAYAFNYLFFDATSRYGMSPHRVLFSFIGIWFAGSVIYFLLLIYSQRSGLVLSVSNSRRPGAGPRRFRFRPTLTRVATFGIVHPSLKSTWRVFRMALWYSSLSAFNLGFREFEMARWLRMLTWKEYEIRPFGAMRTVSGIHALTSFYLFVLWILTAFGQPFD